MACMMSGDYESARDHAKSGADLAANKGFVPYMYWNSVVLYAALVELKEGDNAANISGMRDAIQSCRKIDSRLFNAFWQSLLARAYDQNGQAKEALVTVDKALGEIVQTDERVWETELLHIKGQLLLAGTNSDTTEAEKNFRQAIKIAQSQGAKGWELRVARRLTLVDPPRQGK